MSTAKKLLEPVFRRPLPADSRYAARMEEEFALIDRNEFTRVFLQVQKIMELCQKLVIPHIIRGSAGSSLVCYLMGISHTDPLKYDMDLTRFMNHGRKDLPDIDIDVPYNRRDELYAAVGKQWPGMAARISNHVMYQYKSALQAAIREFAPKVVYRKQTPLETMVTDPEVASRIRHDIQEKIGSVRTESLHCGGIVIFENEGSVPADLVLRTDGILPQITLNKDETEDAGYIKIDILSNRGLAQWWDASAGRRTLQDYPARCDAVARLFATGDTIGITFGESRGQRHIYRKLRPTCVEEIAIALALIRPAAAVGGRKAEYLEAHRTGKTFPRDLERPIVYDDDALARIRAVFHNKGPSTFPKETVDSFADHYRKAYAKQRRSDCIQFRNLCRIQGLSEPTIERLNDDLNQLQHYSFCKSHALSYAQLVWALAYEKIHNTHAFWVAALNHCNSDYRRWVHWREARNAGLRLTRGGPPYRLGSTGAIVSAKGEQIRLLADDHPTQIYQDLKTLGYWCAEEFFPGCYKRVSEAPQQKLRRGASTLVAETEYTVDFCGLVATGRVVRCETDGDESASTGGRPMTFLCIGYDNGKFMDLVVHGARGSLLGFSAVQGVAVQKRGSETIEVKQIRGVTLRSLLPERMAKPATTTAAACAAFFGQSSGRTVAVA